MQPDRLQAQCSVVGGRKSLSGPRNGQGGVAKAKNLPRSACARAAGKVGWGTSGSSECKSVELHRPKSGRTAAVGHSCSAVLVSALKADLPSASCTERGACHAWAHANKTAANSRGNARMWKRQRRMEAGFYRCETGGALKQLDPQSSQQCAKKPNNICPACRRAP